MFVRKFLLNSYFLPVCFGQSSFCLILNSYFSYFNAIFKIIFSLVSKFGCVHIAHHNAWECAGIPVSFL